MEKHVTNEDAIQQREIVKQATLRNVPFWVCLSISIALIVAGFCVPPTGKIDGSVLTAVGELFAFAALWTVWHAILKGVDAKVQHGKTSVTVGNLNDGPLPPPPPGQYEEIP